MQVEEAQTYRERGTRLEELVGVEDPLKMRAEKGARAFARGKPHPAGHLRPSLLLTDSLKAALRRHDLQQVGTWQ